MFGHWLIYPNILTSWPALFYSVAKLPKLAIKKRKTLPQRLMLGESDRVSFWAKFCHLAMERKGGCQGFFLGKSIESFQVTIFRCWLLACQQEQYRADIKIFCYLFVGFSFFFFFSRIFKNNVEC